MSDTDRQATTQSAAAAGGSGATSRGQAEPAAVDPEAPTRERNGLAVLSLISGLSWAPLLVLAWSVNSSVGDFGPPLLHDLQLLAMLLVPVLMITAVVLGRRARRQIADSGGTQSGRGLAVTGFTLGWIGVGLTVAVLAFLLYFLSHPPL